MAIFKATFYRRAIHTSLSVAAVSLFWATGARAQTPPPGCVAALISQSRTLPAGYASRAPRGYCDGRVATPNSGEIRLVSLVRGAISFAPTDTSLKIFTAVGSGEARVHGEDKRSGRSYRLDGVIPPGGLSIELDSGVRAVNVTAPNLGLVAWRPSSEGDIYAPVAMSDGGAVKAVFRADVALVMAASQICLGDQCQAQKIVAAGVPDGGLIEVDIPLAATPRDISSKISLENSKSSSVSPCAATRPIAASRPSSISPPPSFTRDEPQQALGCRIERTRPGAVRPSSPQPPVFSREPMAIDQQPSSRARLALLQTVVTYGVEA